MCSNFYKKRTTAFSGPTTQETRFKRSIYSFPSKFLAPRGEFAAKFWLFVVRGAKRRLRGVPGVGARQLKSFLVSVKQSRRPRHRPLFWTRAAGGVTAERREASAGLPSGGGVLTRARLVARRCAPAAGRARGRHGERGAIPDGVGGGAVGAKRRGAAFSGADADRGTSPARSLRVGAHRHALDSCCRDRSVSTASKTRRSVDP